MEQLYEEMIEEMECAIDAFMRNEISLEELHRVKEEEKLLYNFKVWPQRREFLCKNIFKMAKTVYDELNGLEKAITRLEEMNHSKDVEVDMEDLISHAQILGLNRMAPKGFEHTSWYAPPFPTFQMIDALRDEPEGEQASDARQNEEFEENVDSSFESD